VPSGTERSTVKLLGHPESANLVGFDPEGNVIAAGSYGNFVKLWKPKNGGEAQALNLRGHTSGIQMVALSRDGRRLASAEQGKGIKIWDTSNGQLLKTLKDCPVIADVLAFSPDGRQVAAGYRDVTMKLWNTTGDEEERTLGGQTYRINATAYSPDGHWLASASADGSVKLWDVAAGVELRVLPGHGDYSWQSSVRFSPDGRWLTSASDHSPDETVKVWAMDTLQEKCTLAGQPDAGIALAFSRDGRWVVTGGGYINRRVRIWNLATCRLSQALTGHGHSVDAAEFSPDGRLLATGSGDDTIRIWEVATGQLIKLINLHTPHRTWLGSSVLRQLVFSPDGKRLASAHAGDIDVRVWDVGSWDEVLTLKGHQSGINGLAYLRHGEWIASGSFDGSVRLWDATSGVPLRTINLRSDTSIEQIGFSPDENWIASANADGRTRVWDFASGKERLALIAVGRGKEWVAVVPDGLFDGTADAMQQVAWRKGNSNSVTPLDSFFNDFYYPGLRTESLSETPPAATVDIATALQIPGLRTMLAQSQAHLETRENKAIVCFAQAPSVAVGSTPGEADLPADTNGFRVVPDDATCKYQKELPRDGNASDVVAKLQNWKPEVFKTPWDGKPSNTANATLHVFTVGVGQYPANSGFDPLPYAAKSAKAVEDFFTEQKSKDKKVFAQIRVWPGLYDVTATRDGVRGRLDEMAKAMGEDDVVLLYLAGHGAVTPGQEMFYFVPADGRDTKIRETGMNTAMLAEALRDMPARRVVLVIDACQSGGAVEALSKIGEVKARVEERRGQQEGEQRAGHEHGVGVHVIAATLPLAYAVQLRKEDQSALAVTLLEGLRDGKSSVGAMELIEYLKQRLPEASEKAVGYRQVPLTSSIGLEFKLTADSE
jgi:WD40 repeat protein